MDIEARIQALIDEAAPLRALPDEEGEKLGLNRIILQINALRAEQANSKHDQFLADVALASAPGAPGFGAAVKGTSTQAHEADNAKHEGADVLEFEPDDSVEDDDDEPEAPVKRKPGRPPRAKADE